MSRWYRMDTPREPLGWELLRALARPSSPEAARTLLDNLCNVCGHALGWWVARTPAAPDMAACVNIHCRIGVNNGHALADGLLPEPVYFHSKVNRLVAAIEYARTQEPPPLRWLDEAPAIRYITPLPHTVIRDLKEA